MAKKIVHTCDVCGSDPASTYRISTPAPARWSVDLCDSCAAPILATRTKGAAHSGRRPRVVYASEADIPRD